MRNDEIYVAEKMRVRKPDTGLVPLSDAQKTKNTANVRDEGRFGEVEDAGRPSKAKGEVRSEGARAGVSADSAAVSRRSAGRAFLIIFFTLSIIFLVSITPLFSISGVDVYGNSFYSNSQIISKSGLIIGQNGFSTLFSDNVLKALAFRCANAEQAIISACPYVKSIQVRYVLPHTIRINIEERSNSFVAPYHGSGLLIDGEGVVVDIVGDYRQTELPVVTGLIITDYEIGKALSAENRQKTDAVLSVIGAIKQADRDGGEESVWSVDSIDISDLRNIIIAASNGISVNLGDGTELYYRVSAAKEIIVNGIGEWEKGMIIFSNGARPVFVPYISS